MDPGGPAEGDGGTRGCASRTSRAPSRAAAPTQPLALAMVVEAPPEGDEWLHEIKHDGYRIVARIEEGEVRLVSRNGKDWTKEFPQVARAVGRLPAGTALLDGEVAAVLPNGATSFQALQRRADAAAPLVYFAFDLLHLDGWDLREVRLEERKEVLRRLLESAPATLRFSDHVRGQGARVLREGARGRARGRREQARRRSLSRGARRGLAEGEVPAEPGDGDRRLDAAVGRRRRRSGRCTWASTKTGSSCTRARSAPASASACSPTCSSAWRRGSGTRRPSPPSPPSCGAAPSWVEPDLVAQVEFTQWTDEGRMRQPVFLGLREDRDARHVVRERPGTVEGGGVDTVAAGRPWEALRRHATRTRAASGEEVVDLLGVRLTHPDRVYYPDLGFTKLDLALYYVSIADAVLPYLEGRPLTLVRCPDGIGGETFYQKKAGFWTPPQVRRFAVPGKAEEHLFVDSVPGLVALAQAGILEIHPWNSRVAQLEQPDQVIFDLDPDESLPFSRVAAAARRVRALLSERGLESFVEDDGRQGPARVRAARAGARVGGAGGVHAGGGAAARARRARDASPRTWPRRSARARSSWTTCATSAAPTRWASTRRAPARARRSPSPWTGTSSTGSRARRTSRSRRCRCACWGSDRAARPTRGPATSSSKQRVPASLTRELAD